MDNMEHAIEQAARTEADKRHAAAERSLNKSRYCEGSDYHANDGSRDGFVEGVEWAVAYLREAGLLAPAPLRVELRDSGDLGLTPGAFTQSRWATAWDDGYNAGKNDLRDNRVFRARNPHRGAGQ